MSSASLFATSVALSVGMDSASTRIRTSPSASSVCTVTPSSPSDDMASSASATDTSPAGTSHTTPPSKSMPRLSPRMPKEAIPAMITTPEMASHSRSRPTKSMFVSPW